MTVKFNDNELNALIQRVKPKFEAFENNLNRVSADIRALEKWLRDCGICFYESVAIDTQSSIAWDEHLDSWRLLYLDLDQSEPYHPDGEPNLVSTPLIEISVRNRLKASPYLAKLVEKIGELIPEKIDSAGSAVKLFKKEHPRIVGVAEDQSFFESEE